MTVNIHHTPNHLVRTHDGLTSFRFGRLYSVIPNSLCPHPHIEARFVAFNIYANTSYADVPTPEVAALWVVAAANTMCRWFLA